MRWILCLLLVVPAQAKTLIEQAHEAGALSTQDALIYQLQAAHDPALIPAPYRETPVQPFCGTPLAVAALEGAATLGPEYGARLAKVLARPAARYSRLSPQQRFRIHYDLEGSGAVAATDDDGNGVPDYVDEVARTLEHVWETEIGTMGFRAPPTDGGLGGGAEYDVYLVELGRGGAYGFTYPEVGGRTTHSYLELDNDYTDPVYRQTSGLDALHVTVAHEFNHAIQFGYYQGSDGIWWQEATATWMEDVVYPEVDDYLQYLPSFLLSPEKSLDSGGRYATDFHIYGASIFAHFLDQRFERRVVRSIWEEFGARGSAAIDHFDRAIRTVAPGGLTAVMGEFATWNYFTGSRFRDGYYQEGHKYPDVRMRDIHIDPFAPKVAVEHADQVDHLGCTYLRLDPQLLEGGVTLEVTAPRGNWDQRLILASRDSVQVVHAPATPVVVAGWDRYEEVVLVLTQLERSGNAYEFAAAVTYDPGLVDQATPLALRLGQNRPNPFRPGEHGVTSFPFELSSPSVATRLSIFTLAGQLVRTFDLGARAARQHVQTWDGVNQYGEPVAAGVYYGVLETESQSATRPLVVIRDH